MILFNYYFIFNKLIINAVNFFQIVQNVFDGFIFNINGGIKEIIGQILIVVGVSGGYVATVWVVVAVIVGILSWVLMLIHTEAARKQ